MSKRLNAQRWTTARNAVDIDVRITIFRALSQGEKIKDIVSRDGLDIFGPGFSDKIEAYVDFSKHVKNTFQLAIVTYPTKGPGSKVTIKTRFTLDFFQKS